MLDGTPQDDAVQTAVHDHDIVIVGAGLSGICAGWHLTRSRPSADIAILETREAVGGTWDLFRYPGIRSDSDMPTLGFAFRPWIREQSIADGPSIREYIRETAAEAGLDKLIRFGHRMTSANWDSAMRLWRLTVTVNGVATEFRCRFLMMCTGYYRYSAGHLPEFEGFDDYEGRVIHPQQWPEYLDLQGQRVAVIGSGATAVTLVPELAQRGAHVTMVQRTPSYIAVMPARDAISRFMHKVLGARAAHFLTRWKNILYTMFTFNLSRWKPGFVRNNIMKHIRSEVGDQLDVDKHFRPPYDPWDQRLCLAPDGDFFEAIKAGQVEMVTDQIARFEADGVRMASGDKVVADTVITATGLSLLVAGGAKLHVDGEPISANSRVTYKGAMLSGLPNLALTMGYTNASWTLKCELIARWVVRLLAHMDRHGYDVVTPEYSGEGPYRPFIDLDSGYISRAADRLPKQTGTAPWTVNQNYFRDLRAFRYARIDDGALAFERAPERASAVA